MERILVTRFSAMGDVAMVASVITEFQEQHQETEIIVVSRPFFKPFFDQIPRVIFHPFDPKTSHKGLFGLFKLFKELKNYRSDRLADFHDNLRSRILSFFFRISGIQLATIDKGRKEKRALTRPRDKVLRPLRHTTERYADVLRKLGYTLSLSHQLRRQFRLIPAGMASILATKEKKVGVAPFAQHPYKVLPAAKMEEVLRALAASDIRVLLFGGGNSERERSEKWAQDIPGVTSLIGKYTLREELDIIAHLDLMVSMDSSGMHMASLMGVPCISVWGATHPYAGFLGYGQKLEDCVQIDHPMRPSSIYGNKSCLCDGVEAIARIESQVIIKNIQEKLTIA